MFKAVAWVGARILFHGVLDGIQCHVDCRVATGMQCHLVTCVVESFYGLVQVIGFPNRDVPGNTVVRLICK